MNKLDELVQYIRSKPILEKGDILNKLAILQTTINIPSKKYNVDIIKKYDIIYMDTFAIPHYILVMKVTENEVYGVVLSSKEKEHTLCPLEGDRILQGGFATKLYMCFNLELCKSKFVKIYESKKEADKIFRKLKLFYKESLNL